MLPSRFKDKRYRFGWTYRDAAGRVLGQVARYEGEDGAKEVVPFFQANGKGWKMGAAQEPRPLFGLDSLPEDPAAPVYVVEGEKCAAALHALGWGCVTSPGGARAPHKADWTPLARHTRIVLLPDRDAAGEAYAEAVAGILAALRGSRALRVCRLPDLPEGGDVADWLAARVPDWDGYAPVPREPGDDLAGELLETLDAHAEAAPAPWTGADTAAGAPPVWEPPLSLDAAKVPSWPGAVFPGPVQAFVDALAESTETPVELPALTVLAVLATASQGTCRVRVKRDYLEPLCLWTCCALPSGSRKSAVLNAAAAPLVAWESMERERLQPAIEGARSEAETLRHRIAYLRKKAARATGRDYDLLTEEIRAATARMPVVPREPQLWTADVTPENLPVIMAENGESMAVLSDEGGIFDLMAGRYSGGIPNLDAFLQGHAGTPVRVNRGSRPPVCMASPCLTVGLCPQPDVVHSLADKPGFRGRGLLGRFLYAMPKSNLGRRKGNTAPMPDSTRDAYHATVRAMLAHARAENAPGGERVHVLELSDSARERWRQHSWEVEETMLEEGAFRHLTDWAGKLPGAVARIAAVLHVTRHAHGQPWEDEIAGDTMAAALRLVHALKQHALIAFDVMGADPAMEEARLLRGWIRTQGLTHFTKRDVHRAHTGRFRRAEELDAPLAVLAERHYIQQRPRATNPKGGRPAKVFEVNPLALHRAGCAASM